MNLQLSLKRQWFEMTESGVKPEDYREITPYWCNRLLLRFGIARPIWWWKDAKMYEKELFINHIQNNLKYEYYTFKQFDYNIMTLGYPKATDTSRILKIEHKGIEIRTGNPEWGAEERKLYFIIKHGEILK